MGDKSYFRDSISTVDEKGKRVWIYPKRPEGKYYDARKYLSYLFLILLFSGPYISINNQPLLLLNILERKFIIIGYVFWPQDLHIFALGMVIMIIFISLFTVIFGRLFCGWVCPQTVFMEMVFRRIEYLIEGDWKKQKRLKEGKKSRDYFFKKTLKHIIFWSISFLIANTFLSYIIGYKALLEIIFDHPKNHIIGLLSLTIFTTVFYLVFAKMREQVCTVVCPYGRLQGVLLDSNSLQVAYDYIRGENRAKIRKNENRTKNNKGDCIDCEQCIHVCPTGIDIRNGTQLECVNCTACMDACDFMMERVGQPKGLIRITSDNSIKTASPFKVTSRMKAYIMLLLTLIGILLTMLITRSEIETTIHRTRGTLFHQIENRYYINIYDISLINKTEEKIPITLKITNGAGRIKIIGDSILLDEHSLFKSKFKIYIDKTKLKSVNTDICIGVYKGDKLLEEISTSFISPLF
jgi:cytochrome c oxidase accessory protein FixG